MAVEKGEGEVYVRCTPALHRASRKGAFKNQTLPFLPFSISLSYENAEGGVCV